MTRSKSAVTSPLPIVIGHLEGKTLPPPNTAAGGTSRTPASSFKTAQNGNRSDHRRSQRKNLNAKFNKFNTSTSGLSSLGRLKHRTTEEATSSFIALGFSD